MSTTKKSETKNTNSAEYCQQASQIYSQLKNLEKIMKNYSLNDSLYFIQLTQKCFENEIAKELQGCQ